MTTQLSSLRVTADIDASGYKAGADQKVAADNAMTASSRAVATAMTDTSTKVSRAGDVLAQLSRQFVDGYGTAEKFDSAMRRLSAGVETGRISISQVGPILDGMHQRYGIVADASVFAAKGQGDFAAAIAATNARIESQATSLSRAVGEYKVYINQLKEAQQAANTNQIAAANQNQFNNVLGVRPDATADARASAAVFAAEFARQDEIQRQKSQQAGSNFQSDINSSFGIGAGVASARESAAVFEQAASEADKLATRVAMLRAELDPEAAAQAKVNAELAEYAAMANKGAITSEELAAAQAMVAARSAAGAGAAHGHANALGIGNTQMMALTHSARSFAEQMALGIPITQAAVSELNHLSYAAAGEDGVIAALKKAGPGLLAGILSPDGLIAGFAALTVAAGAYFLLTREGTKTLSDALKEERQAIDDLAKAYDLAKVSSDSYNKSAGAFAGAAARKSQSDLGASASAEDRSIQLQLSSPYTVGRGRDTYFGVKPEFAQFGDAISILNSQITAGRPDYDAFSKRIQEVVAQNPELQKTADKILNIAAAGHTAGVAIKEATDTLERINSRAPSLTDSQLGRDYREQNDITLTWLQRQHDAAMNAIGATSPDERRDAAMAAERAKPSPDGQSAEVTQYKINAAGALAYAQALNSLEVAQEQNRRQMDQTIASAKANLDLVGKSTAETEAQKMATSELAKVREDAARNGIDDEKQFQEIYGETIAKIKETSAEYGKLIALEQARQAIKTGQDDLEIQRAEVTLVGQNKLAHDGVIASLKTEQEIRKLGIPLYGDEANAMRANTAAATANAEALARAQFQQNLLFERQQLFRNADDQQIASALQSAGLPVDLNSQEAQMMRYNMALSETKDTFKGFFTDMVAGLKQGKTLWESLSTAAVNALSKIADKLIDRGLDGIFNSIFGGPSGSTGSNGGLLSELLHFGNGSGSSQQTPSGGASSFLGKLFGGGGQSVGSMQVQAAVVNINGGIGGAGGGLSDILSKLASPDFKANTTLSDILGYGGAANDNSQSYIQTRIDQAFGTGGSAQGLIQSRIDQAFGTTSDGLGGIFTPSGAFASVLGSGGGLTGSIGQYASAIKMIESAGSGGYSALGPVLNSGDQALGAYQVMRSNLPSWSTQAFGSPMSQSQFMSNPAAQDAIFQQQFGKLVDKYGNPQDAASAWFTGGPLSSGAGKSDVLGTTGSAYVDKFNAALSKLGGVTDHATSSIGGLGSASEGLISQFSKMGQSLLSQLTPATSSSSWFQGLSSMFGGSAGALGYMNSISPAATSDILSGSWGLFDGGGFTGTGGAKQPAGIVHRGEIVWSQDDIRRAGGVHVVEGMRRGYAGYADGGIVRPRYGYNDGSAGRAVAPANDRPAQTIQQTNNFIFKENPAAPASQNQIAAKSARSLERLQRTA